MANKIFDDYQGASIKINDVCYKFIGETTQPFNTDPSVIGGTYDSCLECKLESSSSSSSEAYSESSSTSSFGDPEVYTIKNIDGDYSSLAAFEAARNTDFTDRGVVLGLVDSGFNAGTCVISGGTNQDENNHLKIAPADGHKHDGTTALNGAYCSSSGSVFTIVDPYVEIDGMRVIGTNTFATTLFAQGEGHANHLTVKNCVFQLQGANSAFCIFINVYNVDGVFNIINNSFYCSGSETRDGAVAFQLYENDGTYNYTLNTYNNSIYNYGTRGFYIRTLNDVTVDWNCQNNISMDNGGDDFYTLGIITENVDYCCSSDTTANSWLGSGNLISKSSSDQWTTVGSDHSVKNSSADIYAAGIAISGVETDILGTTRKDPPDIGAFELNT